MRVADSLPVANLIAVALATIFSAWGELAGFLAGEVVLAVLVIWAFHSVERETR